jgi:hypothetical protein
MADGELYAVEELGGRPTSAVEAEEAGRRDVARDGR